MPENIFDHPCLDGAAGQGVGATLKTAGKASFKLRYSYDPPTPGTPLTMNAAQALVYVQRLTQGGKPLGMACITGPGEPMADPDATLEVVRAIKAAHPQALFCLCTSGLGLPEHVPALAAAGVSRVALYVNAVDLDVARQMYAWVRPGKRTLPGDEGLQLLLADQAASLGACVAAGMEVTVESLVVPGVTLAHLPAIAAWAKTGGAASMRLYPARYADAETLAVPPETLRAAEAAVSAVIPLKPSDCCCGDASAAELTSVPGLGPTAERPNVAVATTDGAEVNEHLGYAEKFLVYASQGGHGRMVGVRMAPPKGGGEARWQKLAEVLGDCFAVLAADAGDNPRRVLTENGIQVRSVPGAAIEDAVADALGLAKKKR